MEEALGKGRFRTAEDLGRWVRLRLTVLLDLSTLLYLTFRELAAERRKGISLIFEITLRQIFFTGVEALKVTTLVAVVLGGIIIVQAGSKLAFLGGVNFIVPTLVLAIFRELGPLLTAVIVIGRSGTAIAAELGNMIVAHELEAIQVMGLNPIYFLVVPRVIGVTVAVVCLTVFFDFIALLGGFFISKLILVINFAVFIREVSNSLTSLDLGMSILKGAIFGLLIGLTCTYHGLTVRYSPIEVPQVATRAVVSAILFCFTINALITFLAYL